MVKTTSKASIAIIILLALALLTIKGIKSCRSTNENTEVAAPQWKDDGRNKRSEWRYQPLEYTAHAKCRMQCRQISEVEVAEILRSGTINYKKSNLNDKPCPTYAIEGNTNDGQKVRIVFAACKTNTRVVTTIDIGKEHECDCK
ncbi:MAG TPA: DUF4258 domain-containing protein [Bacteroidia bacterium]|nr:DUF4258 domain-containing protein [Bacteroidia bacterium]QQR96242.1 MAG: DUF4258 domain-containing protein [Bacteroidota bacterium]MBP7713842.1 DUF4258 domain-containing protein [Bacteroidia bacterium]MBP8668206.1 DUF4258 domain-containing protein [Bacteroidia bacterium]HQW17816.1 DUF4258 domain-containing protein [Bacteroidia bacterium]